MENAAPFTGLEPAALWRHFAAITRIPRPSGHEAGMVEYIRSWAAARNYRVARDGAGNLCVSVPATHGRDQAPVVVMQGHLDMVCERNADSPYDAEKGNIHPVRNGEWIVADGTTLGADNGIGVATMLAAAEAEDEPHGPLELLFTLDEERGLTGAQHLDPALVRGRILLNLDSEDDGIVFVGCAGGADTTIHWEAPRTPAPAGWKGLRVAVSGLQGGHSGTDINRNRLNAIRALARVLQEAAAKAPLMLAEIRGGNKRNAIPRECGVSLYCPGEAEQGFRQAVAQTRDLLAAQYRGLDDGLNVVVEAHTPGSAGGFTTDRTNQLLDLLRAIPTGVLAMSQDIPGLVETSSNLAVIGTSGAVVEIVCSSRSSVAGALRDVLGTHEAIARLAGGRVEQQAGYPGWKPDLSSRVLAVTKEAYRRLFGSEPVVTAVHAGLECGLIGERVPGMDMVSFGPQISGAHAPGERVHIPSVAKFCKHLAAVLDDLSK